jgi:glycerophosphoryl diester phosphodiesterase
LAAVRPADPVGSARPFLVAHRAANDLAGLRAAEAAGARVVEADVHLHRNRLEVRHLKTAGPLPLLWDRWRVANPFAPRLVLPDLFAALSPATALVLDLKGRDARLADAVARMVDESSVREVIVCARSWALLERLDDHPSVRPVHSAGHRFQIRALHRRYGCRSLAGVAVHERLLTSRLVAELRSYAALVMTWPVNTFETAGRVLDWGVDGLVTDRLAVVSSAVESHARLDPCPAS